jgi:lipopolysaccharide/colanic/teichoic acid biosynthesis glycosyltransferase
MRSKVLPRFSSDLGFSNLEYNNCAFAGRKVKTLPKWKRLFDVVIATAALILAAPLIIAVALLVSLDGGAAFYLQPRLGLGGRRFILFKIRTMCRNSDAVLDKILRGLKRNLRKPVNWGVMRGSAGSAAFFGDMELMSYLN